MKTYSATTYTIAYRQSYSGDTLLPVPGPIIYDVLDRFHGASNSSIDVLDVLASRRVQGMGEGVLDKIDILWEGGTEPVTITFPFPYRQPTNKEGLVWRDWMRAAIPEGMRVLFRIGQEKRYELIEEWARGVDPAECRMTLLNDKSLVAEADQYRYDRQ